MTKTVSGERPARRLEDIEAALRFELPELRRRWGVRSMGVFGSYARGQQRRGSDLDVLVEFDGRPLSLLRFIELEQHLSDLLGVKVDLVERDTLRPAMSLRILDDVRPL